MTEVRIEQGDCRDICRQLAVDGVQVDAVITDPPYHLGSIVKRFGGKGSALAQQGKDGAFARLSRGFMGKEWDGGDVAFQAETWATIAKVMKPGAHLMAFGASKNWHRLTAAIEDAGLEIRRHYIWMYGSGMAKAKYVGPQIDKKLGHAREIKKTTRARNVYTGAKDIVHDRGHPVSDLAADWEGWADDVRPAFEPIVVARKPVEKSVAANVMVHGVGGLNIDVLRGADGQYASDILIDDSADVQLAFAATEPPAFRFFYCAKADAEQRLGSNHPTVKPLRLMQDLIRFTTKPGQLILDPFAGSGTTGEAALLEGRCPILIERDSDYVQDIHRRIARAQDDLRARLI